MLGVGGTPLRQIKNYMGGTIAQNSYGNLPLNVAKPFFSMPLLFNNQTQYAVVRIAAYNEGGAPSYCSDFSEWAIMYGCTPVNQVLSNAQKIWNQPFTVNGGVSSLVGVVTLGYAANVLSVNITPQMGGATPQSPNRIDAIIQLYGTNRGDPVTVL